MSRTPWAVRWSLPPLVLLALLAAARTVPVRSEEPLRTAGERPVDIQHIRLDLRVDLPKKTVDATATLNVKALRPLNSFRLDAEGFEVRTVTVEKEGQKPAAVRFSHDGGKLAVDLDAPWPADQAATLRIEYRVREPKTGLHFFGPTTAEPDVPLTVWSQGEPITNRFWFPCLDQPNQRQTTELVVTVADGFEALSNGKLVERKVNDDKTVTFHWKQDKPHPAYLVTLVVGQFDRVDEEWRGVPVAYYVPRGRKDDVARTFGRTKDMLTFFSQTFGVDYPWDKYAQVVVEQFNAGGMENTSATTLTERALHDARAALDSSPDGLIAHELGHQWWGDLVTCRDWAHIWLNEGFATYCEVLWAEHAQGQDEAAYLLLQKAKAALNGGKDRPVVDRRYEFPRTMFDARAYPKGGWVLHMLRRQLGDEAFFKCLKAHATEHRLKSVETADFRHILERETGRDLERFFYDWTERPGHPVLDVASEYQPDSQQVKVTVKQTQAGEAFAFPLAVRVVCPGDAGKDVVSRQTVTSKEATFTIAVPSRPTLVEVDPEQSLLAEIKETKGRDLWLAQLSAPAGVAARCRAVEYFGKSKAPADREALAKALAAEPFWGVQAEIATALGESGGDVCRDALLDGLKANGPKVRRACAEHLSKFRGDAKAAAALKELLAKGDDSYFVEAAALAAYSKLDQADLSAVLLPWLAKPSHNEVLRTAALDGLANVADLSSVDVLIAWTKRGKPRPTRIASLHALGRVLQKHKANEELQKKAVPALTACLEGETMNLQLGAINALREAGRSATTALGALDALARHDPEDRVRDLAKKVAEQVRGTGATPADMAKLREELDKLKQANESLQQRLEKVEKKGS